MVLDIPLHTHEVSAILNICRTSWSVCSVSDYILYLCILFPCILSYSITLSISSAWYSRTTLVSHCLLTITRRCIKTYLVSDILHFDNCNSSLFKILLYEAQDPVLYAVVLNIF